MVFRSTRCKIQVIGGTLLFALFLKWGGFDHGEPFYTFFYLFAWVPFLWVIDRLIAGRTGEGPMSNPLDVLKLFCLSVTFWLIFEAFNLRLHNWGYVGVPMERAFRWPGYALSFATVMPGILWLRKLMDSYLPASPPMPAPVVKGPRGKALLWCYPVGLLMLLLPLRWPHYFFPLIWGGVFFLLDPWVARNGGHSLLNDWKSGTWRWTGTLLTAGLLCGVFWEACNSVAGSKWAYALPYWGFGKVFEMPILGYVGFLPFALETHAFHQAAILFWRRRTRWQRIALAAGMVLFWLGIFYEMDINTVLLWRL